MNQPYISSTKQTTSSKKTLDIQHNNKLNEFHAKAERLSAMKSRYNGLMENIIEIENKKKSSQISKEEQDNLISMIDDRESLKKAIDEMENNDDELDYLVNTATILFKYYDIIEKGTGDEYATTKINDKSILKWFSKAPSTEMNEKDIKEPKEDRAALLDKYLSFTDDNYMKQTDTEVPTKCQNCNSTNMNVQINDGLIYCNDCCCVEYIIVDHDRPSYKDPPREISYFAYKRINHFNEWLSQIQGKETTEIPEEIYDSILLEIKKQGITNMVGLSTEKIKEILKKLKANKYYEHAPHIKHKLNGLPIPHLEPELEEKLRTMFKLIQPPFLKYKPVSRKNFLSYSYVLHKFIQLLGKDEHLPNFPLLKSRDKLQQQDQIWKKICEDLNWHFIRSI
jgi:hypothetical protein